MHIAPFEELRGETVLDGGEFSDLAFPGQDSVVYHHLKTQQAVHVYHAGSRFERVLRYAQHVEEAADALTVTPFIRRVSIRDRCYDAVVRVNPIDEVGERRFSMGGKTLRRPYTTAPFIAGPSLCWPNQASDEELRMISRALPPAFYDEVDAWIYDHTALTDLDTNPVNVKYTIDEKERRLLLTVTDLAKSIYNVRLKGSRLEMWG